MRSKDLLEKLIVEHRSAYKISKISGVSQQRLSQVKNKENRNFQADELLKFQQAGMITIQEMLKISFADRLKDPSKFKLVAAWILGLPVVQFAIQFLNDNGSQCILC
jgi:hypothetical protein